MVALSGHDIVGVLDLWAGDKPHNRHVARLGTSVLADYRRRGIGRRLLRSAIREATAWPGFCRIELDVVPWNAAAIRLYQSEGFVHEGTKRKAINIAGKMADLNVMARVW
jgi:RimJ/RimL family protein N-acetyltransferase